MKNAVPVVAFLLAIFILSTLLLVTYAPEILTDTHFISLLAGCSGGIALGARHLGQRRLLFYVVFAFFATILVLEDAYANTFDDSDPVFVVWSDTEPEECCSVQITQDTLDALCRMHEKDAPKNENENTSRLTAKQLLGRGLIVVGGLLCLIVLILYKLKGPAILLLIALGNQACGGDLCGSQEKAGTAGGATFCYLSGSEHELYFDEEVFEDAVSLTNKAATDLGIDIPNMRVYNHEHELRVNLVTREWMNKRHPPREVVSPDGSVTKIPRTANYRWNRKTVDIVMDREAPRYEWGIRFAHEILHFLGNLRGDSFEPHSGHSIPGYWGSSMTTIEGRVVHDLFSNHAYRQLQADRFAQLWNAGDRW